jgi:hypothetical protein
MPLRSKAQSAAMHSAAEGRSTLGIPKSVGQEFVNASHGQRVRDLPERVAKKAQGGAVRDTSYPPKFRW